MIKFIKTENEKNSYDISEVTIQTKYHDATIEDLCGMFKSFLQGCGFSIDSDEEIDVVKSYNSESHCEKIDIDLDDSDFKNLCVMAHEKDITLNELVNELLKEYIDGVDANEKFNKVVSDLKLQDEINKEMSDFEHPIDRCVVPEDDDYIITSAGVKSIVGYKKESEKIGKPEGILSDGSLDLNDFVSDGAFIAANSFTYENKQYTTNTCKFDNVDQLKRYIRENTPVAISSAKIRRCKDKSDIIARICVIDS